MTLDDVLLLARRSDIHLRAEGNTLVVDAPTGTLTPELRDVLTRHKPALLVRLAPATAFVTLKGGLVLPAAVIELAVSLEARGISLRTDHDHQFIVPVDPRLTEADRAAILRWRHHLGAAIEYRAPEIA